MFIKASLRKGWRDYDVRQAVKLRPMRRLSMREKKIITNSIKIVSYIGPIEI